VDGARVEILVADRDNALSVPVKAVIHYDDKDHVAVKKPDDGFEWREVTVSDSNGTELEIKQGLNSGEQVSLDPTSLLSEE
jgi:multidrug efflux pump subunit AcrA (membrane-fusion protein)